MFNARAFQDISPVFLMCALDLYRLADENMIDTQRWDRVVSQLRWECNCQAKVVDDTIEFRLPETTLVLRLPGETNPVSARRAPNFNPPSHSIAQPEVVH